MSRVALVASVLVALVLGAVTAWVMLGGGRGGSALRATGIVSIREGDLESMRVEHDASGSVEIRRGPLADLWLMAEGGREYPVEAARVRAMLRVLAEASVRPGGDQVGERPWATVELRTRGGGETRLEMVGEPLGGHGRVRLWRDGAGVSMVAPEAVPLLFRRASLLAWRSNAVFPAGTGQAARIQIRGEAGEGVSLSRLGGRWGLVAPVSSHAEESAVEGLLTALDRATILRFVDEVEGGKAEAAVFVESEIREFEGEVVTRRVLAQSLEVLGRSSERAVLARLEGRLRSPDGSEQVLWSGVAEVRLEAWSAVSARPEAYLSVRSYAGAAADVGWVAVGEERGGRWYRRDLETWVTGEGGDAGVALGEQDAATVRRFVDLLCTARAERTALAADVPFEEATTVWIGTPRAEPLARFEIGLVEGADGRRRAAVRSEGVVRLYVSAEPIEWLLGQR